MNFIDNFKSNLEKPKSNNLVLVLLSIFSVLFGCSNLLILEEVNVFTGLLVLLTLIIYSINEYYKSNSIFNYSLKRNSVFLIIGVITILISLTSIYGIYQVIDRFAISKKEVDYEVKIDSVKRLINSTYADSLVRLQNSDLQYNKKNRDSIQVVLSLAKKKIQDNLELEIKSLQSKQLSVNKNLQLDYQKKESNKKIVLFFFLLIVFMVEIGIIVLSYNKGLSYKDYYNRKEKYEKNHKVWLESKLAKSLRDYISALNFTYTNYQVGDRFVKSKFKFIDDVEGFVDLMINLKIFEGERSIIIKMSKENAQKTLNDYCNDIYENAKQSF